MTLSLGPFFTLHPTPISETPEASSLGITLEWSCAAQVACVPLFRRKPRDQGKLPPHLRVEPKHPRLREILCRQQDLPLDVEFIEADAMDTSEGMFISLEALLLALYRQHSPQRHIHTVLRELVELVPLHSSVAHPVADPDGLLAPEVEARGYRITTILADGNAKVVDVGWRPTPTASPIHAGLTEFQKELLGKWLPTAEVGVTQLLAEDLQKVVGTPNALLTEKGKKFLLMSAPACAAKASSTPNKKRGIAATG